MSSWMNDAAAVQNHNGAAFNHLADPNVGGNMLDPSAFMANPNSFDPSQFQSQQMHQRLQNGTMRNASPSFNNPAYQTNPIIPSKRPRPREDSISASPRQAHGMPPNSRSQTPQQAGYPGFQPNGQTPQQPHQYSHLQHNGSNNASPSPIMGNQLRPGAVPQRVATTSPHPFSPAAQQFAPQASPSHSDHGSRVDTPQNQYMLQNPNFQPGFNQTFTPPPGRPSGPPSQGAMPTPQMPQPQMQQPQMYGQQQLPHQQQARGPQQTLEQQQKMMYQMQLQQQLQRGNLLSSQRMQSMPQNSPLVKPQMPNGQFPQAMRPQQPVSRPNNPEQFMKQLNAFMQARGMPLDMNPIVGDRPINIVMLYMAVAKSGGYKRVTRENLWPQVAQALQCNPAFAQQIKGHYERNLMMFEDAYQAQQAQQRQKAMVQQNIAAGNMSGLQHSPTKSASMQGQMQSAQYMPQPQQQHMIPQQHMGPPQHGQNTPVKQTSQPSPANSFSTPQVQLPSNAQAHTRNSLPRSTEVTPQNGVPFVTPSPVSAGKASNFSVQPDRVEQASITANRAPKPFEMKAEYTPFVRTMDSWGGLDASTDELSALTAELLHQRPNVPLVTELGVIDIHALTMSLQSGIHAEVRLALDTLATLSVEPRLQLDLKACDDLVELIVDCAESQVELLAENAAEVSDVMLISSYEDVIRGCRFEREGVQDVPEFGSLEYELDRAVERLICITTILRNLSFYESNHHLLADEMVIKVLCIVIRYLGTRNMLLRTNTSTLDFMKDVIIFLSNLAQAVEISGKEQALCLLHFLLAFAPCPPPCSSGTEKVVFSPYDPAVHRYLPPAVDSLAKFLARDQPNRTFYKAIFASEAMSVPSYDLLTKTFALAISPIPGHKRDEQRPNLMQVVDARKPHLMQGMLAAEILSNLVPGSEAGLARSWLSSEDGFAQSLLRLITVLASEASPLAPHRGAPPPRGADDEALLHITISGITVLQRLSEKARNPDDLTSIVPLDGMIKQENLLGALLLKPPAQPTPEVMKLLCAYAALDR
ncbi:MAG: hypothetical protein M1818_003173 [Claussenomyces sp. TS43310]|nr:MAG: hypothetical protein M1818_003173 [Claussenomyces sp. TS43310]